MRLIIRWIITTIALGITVMIIPGIHIQGANAIVTIALVAILLGLINAIVRPILTFLSCGCVIASLGLFLVVINALCLWMTAYISTHWFNIGFSIDGFWPALWGSIVVSIVSFALSVFLPERDK